MQNPIVLLYGAMYLRQRRGWGSLARLNTLFAAPAPLLLNTVSLAALANWLFGSTWLFENMKVVFFASAVIPLVIVWFCAHRTGAGLTCARRLRSRGRPEVKRAEWMLMAYIAASVISFFVILIATVPFGWRAHHPAGG